MLPTTFPRFQELAFELRSNIWEYAIALHIQDIADRLPPWFENSWAEGRRQAPIGSSLGKANSALCVRILDPYNGRKLRFEEDEFETLVDCLSISAVCREARICVAEFCQPLVPHVRCKYETCPLWSLKPPKDGSQPVVIRNLHCQPEAETLKHFFSQPTTLTIDMGRFKSAEHFVNIVSRFFGNRIQRLVLVQVVCSVDHLKRAYWADSNIPRRDNSIDVILKNYAEGDPTLMCVTRHGELYASRSFWRTEAWLPLHLALHLLKIHEIFNVSLERLPCLEHVEVNLEVQGWDTEKSKIVMIYKRDVGVLAVTSSDPIHWPQPPPWVSSALSPPLPALSL